MVELSDRRRRRRSRGPPVGSRTGFGRQPRPERRHVQRGVTRREPARPVLRADDVEVVLLVVGPLEAAQEREAVAGERLASDSPWRVHTAWSTGPSRREREEVGVVGQRLEVDAELVVIRLEPPRHVGDSVSPSESVVWSCRLPARTMSEPTDGGPPGRSDSTGAACAAEAGAMSSTAKATIRTRLSNRPTA